jgi:hypothetical protein
LGTGAVLLELFFVITIDYIALNEATRDLSRLLHVEAAIERSKRHLRVDAYGNWPLSLAFRLQGRTAKQAL